MKKIVVLTEGLTEMIFVRQLLINLIGFDALSFECLELRGQEPQSVPYSYSSPEPIVHALILNVGGDERVLSVIKERENHFVEAGYDQIVGLRDIVLYPKNWTQKSCFLYDPCF